MTPHSDTVSNLGHSVSDDCISTYIQLTLKNDARIELVGFLELVFQIN